jgi:hypothetical protein
LFEELRFPVLALGLITMFEKEEEENQGIIDYKSEQEDPLPRCKTKTEYGG